MNSAIIIPIRESSTRFPNKFVYKIYGKSMIERTWRIACNAQGSDENVYIAVDTENLKEFCKGFGAKVIMTDTNCQSGTDRVHNALSVIEKKYDVVVNLQADTPLLPPHVLKELLSVFEKDEDIQIATPVYLLNNEEMETLHAQKMQNYSTGTLAVFDKNMNAMYFSKSFIPFLRDKSVAKVYRHIGVYGYKTEALEKYVSFEQTSLEKVEKLEQLRALENGMPIKVAIVDLEGRKIASVDNPEDIAVVEKILDEQGELTM